MKRVDIKVGYTCNNRCKFCVQGNKRDLMADNATDKIKSILLDCFCDEIESVVFTGGEATIRKDLCELIRFAASLGFKEIQIQTNGRMFAYLDFCKKVIDAGATEFAPAVHGHNHKIHDFLTSIPGSFQQTIQGIKNLKKLNQRVLTNTVITNHNYKHLPDIARLLVSLNVDQFQFAFIHVVGTSILNSDWIVPQKKEIMFYVKKGLAIGLKAGKTVMTEAIPYCFMKHWEDFIAEEIIPLTKVFENNLVIEDFTASRLSEGKAKMPQCLKCKHNSYCEGAWKEYLELFGNSELIPCL